MCARVGALACALAGAGSRADVCACVRAYVRACVCVRACVRAFCFFKQTDHSQDILYIRVTERHMCVDNESWE